MRHSAISILQMNRHIRSTIIKFAVHQLKYRVARIYLVNWHFMSLLGHFYSIPSGGQPDGKVHLLLISMVTTHVHSTISNMY